MKLLMALAVVGTGSWTGRVEIAGMLARMRRIITVVGLVIGAIGAAAAQQSAALKIVVLEGEGAVNIIQQKMRRGKYPLASGIGRWAGR